MNEPFACGLIWFPNSQVKKTEEEKQSEKDKALIPKTEDVKLEAKDEATEESKEKQRRPQKRRQAKKS